MENLVISLGSFNQVHSTVVRAQFPVGRVVALAQPAVVNPWRTSL
jgi:hypothetical protein